MTGHRDLSLLLASEGVVFSDGAMGTLLLNAGFGASTPVEAANVEAPDLVMALHRAYLAAGSQMIQTNTFGANRFRLARFGWEHRAVDLARAGVRLAQEATAGRALIAGAIGPVGEVAPLGTIPQSEAAQAFQEQAIALAEAGVDLLLVETMYDLRQARLALRTVREATGLPVVCSITYGGHAAVFSQLDPATAAQDLLTNGATLVGVNCGPGPTTAYTALAEIHRALPDAPLLGQPSAGIPDVGPSKLPPYYMTPERFAQWGLRLLDVGVRVLGGCCGTTPEHVRSLVEAVRQRQQTVRR